MVKHCFFLLSLPGPHLQEARRAQETYQIKVLGKVTRGRNPDTLHRAHLSHQRHIEVQKHTKHDPFIWCACAHAFCGGVYPSLSLDRVYLSRKFSALFVRCLQGVLVYPFVDPVVACKNSLSQSRLALTWRPHQHHHLCLRGSLREFSHRLVKTASCILKQAWV